MYARQALYQLNHIPRSWFLHQLWKACLDSVPYSQVPPLPSPWSRTSWLFTHLFIQLFLHQTPVLCLVRCWVEKQGSVFKGSRYTNKAESKKTSEVHRNPRELPLGKKTSARAQGEVPLQAKFQHWIAEDTERKKEVTSADCAQSCGTAEPGG